MRINVTDHRAQQGVITATLFACMGKNQGNEERARLIIEGLARAGFSIVRPPASDEPAAERVEYARRTGCWDGVTDRDYRAWLASLQQTAAIAPEDERALRKAVADIGFALRVAYWSGAAGRRYEHAQDARDIVAELARDGIGFREIPGRTVVLDEHDEAAIREAAAAPVPPGEGIAGVEERPITDREISDMLAPGYHKALHLIRGGQPSASEVAAALGGESGNGPQGNVWALFDARNRTLATGRVSAATYADGKGSPVTVRHAERVTLEPGKIEELPPGTRDWWPSPLQGNVGAVRDLVTAHRLIARAAGILGQDAADEILNNLADPAVESEAA